MGVLKSLRNEGAAEFLIKADELRIFTTKTVAKLPKKYTFYGSAHAYELAQAIFDDLMRANSLYLSKDKPDNYQARHNLFDRALGNLNCLSSHIVYLCELTENSQDKKLDKQPNPKQQKNNTKAKTITEKRWLAWAALINVVKSLVAKVRDSDTQRIK